MKRMSLFVLICVAMSATSCADSTAEGGGPGSPQTKRYGIEKACIEYEMQGSMFGGTEILYFDQYGAREAKYQKHEVKVAGMSQKTNQVVFIEDDVIYTIDLDRNTGTKTTMAESMKGKDMRAVGEKMLADMGGKKVGTEKVLDRSCEIWEIKDMGTRTWLWKGVPLKTESNMMGMAMTILATKISDTFDKSKLERPKNIKYQDMGNVMDLMKGMKKSN